MLRVFVVVVLTCCGHKTVPPVVGLTQATAIAVPLSVGPDRTSDVTGTLKPTPVSVGSRWYVVTLPVNQKRTLSVSVGYDGAARSVDVELLDPAGQVLSHASTGTHNQYDLYGWRFAELAEAQGTYFIRVTARGGARRYGLDISSTAITPGPKEWDPCNAYVYDAENPRCKGIVPCDPNKPVTTNPSCCSKRCMRGRCTGTLTRAEEGYAWFSLGANSGITTWYDGTTELAVVGGTYTSIRLNVVEVEPKRSKVLLGRYSTIDASRIDGRVAWLQTPGVCGED